MTRASTVLLTLAGTIALSTGAAAQVQPQGQTAAPDSAPIADDIVVTAQKRSESIQTVPLSITAVGSKEIDNLGARNFTDLLSSVPSLTAYQNGPGRSQIIIRGITSNSISEDEPQTQETVGLYVDETPISVSGFNPEQGLFDLERVEVLRGPQGTLYGAGAMSGAIRLITRKPDATRIEGRAEADLSFTDHGATNYDAKGVINLPIVRDKVALRVTGYYDRDGGYIDNIETGERNVNRNRALGGRAALRVTPTANLVVDLSAFHHNFRDGARPIDEGDYTRSYISRENSHYVYDVYNGTVNYDTGGPTLTSSTSYLAMHFINRRQLDKTLATITTDLHSALADQTSIGDFTQEVRIASPDASALRWLVGVYYNTRKRDYLNAFPVPGIDAELGISSPNDFGAPTDFLFYGQQRIRVHQGAVFGEAGYTLDRFTLTAGVRYFDWHEQYSLRSSGLFNGGVTATGPRTLKTDGFNPKVNLTYKIDDQKLVYAQAAKGFRFGGINDVIPQNVCATELAGIQRTGDPSVYGPDKLWNYEIGTKTSFDNRRITINASGYLIKWKDIQTNRDLNCGFGFRENAGSLTSKGVELEATLKPVEGLTLSGGGAYTHSALDKDVPNLAAVAGDRAPYVPRWSGSTTANYVFPLRPGVRGLLWANYQYVGRRATEFDTAAARYRAMAAYGLLNLRVGAYIGETELSAFVRNATDSGGVLRALPATPFDFEGRIRVEPRTIGVTARSSF
ncbi:TonB-dependent receptor [Sphingomonas bacterium]|uniref:TonB-dependent receptor n=1 Tax=Sphingomonas bacterium TaxID=1895847 RepID=UPI001575882E|nr:TonB-dependent receptor [Sphingomonas bacterium]